MFNYGERFKELRKTKNISANKLSKILSIDPSTISKIENGSAFPSIQLLEKLCTYFDITLADFFNDGSRADSMTHELKELLDHAKKLNPEQMELVKKLIENMKG